jgi:hypothetical protein
VGLKEAFYIDQWLLTLLDLETKCFIILQIKRKYEPKQTWLAAMEIIITQLDKQALQEQIECILMS